MDLVYGIFIYPLELVMEWVLETALSKSGDPLLSLFAVSLVVSIGSLPLYHIAEKWQDLERDIQKKLRPKISEFKSVFKGAVLNSYIRTIYRQMNYHPIYAVRTSFGLLIQIPFFFAAYHLLSNYTGFSGAGAFIFKDLGKPDGLLSLGTLTVNLMPFLMTGINLISASIYGKKTTLNEKFQLYGMALFFLVVLYNSSSALLFYWTCNNIFSLIKNIIYNAVYKNGVITSGSKYKLKIPGMSFCGCKYIKRPDGWVIFMLLTVSALAYHSIYEHHGRMFDNSIPVLFITFMPLIIAVFYILECFVMSSIVRSVLAAVPKNDKDTDSVYIYSISVFVLLAFIALPLSILSSGSGADFEGTFYHFFNHLFAVALFAVTALYGIFRVFSSRIKYCLSFVMAFLAFSGLLNAFIFTGNYGDISHFVFSDELEIDIIDSVLNCFAWLSVFFVLLYAFFKRKFGIIKTVLMLVLLSLVLFSANESLEFSSKRKTGRKDVVYTEKPFFEFSKNGKNVVILMLDRFIGGYFPELLEMMPEIKDDLDGFVYYKNTLSPASYTIGGVPAIMGGWEYTVKEINNARDSITLVKKLDESVRIMPYNFDKAGFDVTIYHNDLTRWFNDNDRSNIGRSVFIEPDFPKYRELWLEKHKQNQKQDKDNTREKLSMFGLFRAAPVFLREFIYDGGEWHFEKQDEGYKKPDEKKYVSFYEKSQWKKSTTQKYYAVLDFLPEFSRIVEEGNDRFYYMSNDLPHEPHTINSSFEVEISGKISYPRTVYNRFSKSLNALKHLYTDGAALRLVNEWLKWMKDSGVYDNTRIIIVSDHGRDVYNPFFKKQNIPGGRKKSHPAYYNNFLIVKDFNSRGELLTDDTFMSSADVPFVAMKGIVEGINPYTGRKIASPGNKFPFYTYDVQWRLEKQEKNKFKIHEGYRIEKEEDLNDPAKWKVIYE